MGGSKPAQPKVQETGLSREQLAILKDRERFAQNFTIPALQKYLNDVKGMEFNSNYKLNNPNMMLQQNVGSLRANFAQNRDQMSLALAQRGLGGSGIEANALTQLGAAEASGVSNTVNQSNLQAMLERNQIIDMQNRNSLMKQEAYQSALGQMLALAPQPTGAVPQNGSMVAGKESPWGATLSGGIQGATIGGQYGGPWGAVIGGVVGAGSGYASAT